MKILISLPGLGGPKGPATVQIIDLESIELQVEEKSSSISLSRFISSLVNEVALLKDRVVSLETKIRDEEL